tara:strand:+ start:44 stop:763 length:720 start_codon:yes stop_codon:yes gene_type:complete
MDQGKRISILIFIIIIIIYSISIKHILFASILFSLIVLFIDKFINISKFYDKDDKYKIDYRKYLFILIYIYLVLQYSQINLNVNKNISQKKLVKFLLFIIIPCFIFTFSSSDNSTFQTIEYIIYNLNIFTFIFIFNRFIVNIKEFKIIKVYLNIITLLGFILFVLKPLILELPTAELLSKKMNQIKWSNYYYFNKNIKTYDNSKNYNKRYFNSLMNYIIINIILIGFYLGIVYWFKELK